MKNKKLKKSFIVTTKKEREMFSNLKDLIKLRRSLKKEFKFNFKHGILILKDKIKNKKDFIKLNKMCVLLDCDFDIINLNRIQLLF